MTTRGTLLVVSALSVMVAAPRESRNLSAQTIASRPELVVQNGHPGLQSPGLQIERVTFSADSRLIATAERAGTIRIWDAATGMQLWSVPGRATSPFTIQFSGDGRWLVYADPAGGVTAWAMGDERRVRRLRGARNDHVSDLTISADSSLVAAVADAVRVWDLDSAQQIAELPVETSQTTLAFSPATGLLAIREPSRVRFWSRREPNAATIPLGNQWGPRAMLFLEGGATLAVPDGDRINIVDVASRRVSGRMTVGQNATLHRLADSPRTLVVGAADRYEVWDVMTRRKVRDLPPKRGAGPEVPSPSWERIAVQQSLGAPSVTVRDLVGGRDDVALGGNTAIAGAVAFSPDGSLLATKSGGRFWLWDLRSGEPRMFEGHKAPRGGHVEVDTLSFSGDGTRLMSGDLLSNMLEWDVATGRLSRALDLSWRKSTLRHVCSADGRWCASADDERTVVLDVATWRTDRTFPVGTIGLAMTSDGSSIAAAGHEEVEVMDRRNGARRELRSHTEQVTSVAFSPDDRLLASAALNGEVKIWDVATAQELTSFSSGHEVVITLAFSRDSRTLSTGGTGDTIGVWDSRTGQLRHRLSGHTDKVTGLAFSPDDRFLVSGSIDGTTRIWNLEQRSEVALLTVRKDSEDWLVVTPDGRFDGSARGTETLVAWRVGSSVYPAERYFSNFFTPGVLAALWHDAVPSPRSTIAEAPVAPAVRIQQNSGRTVKDSNLSLKVRVQGAATEVNIYHNGARVANQPGADAAAEYTFDLTLIPGENELRAVAIGQAGVESNPDTVRVTYEAPSPAKPSLHVLSVGVSRYRGPNWNLAFARADAQAIAKFFTERGQKLFAAVSASSLVDDQATRANILQALTTIADRARPEDVVLLYFAGHGMSVEQTYFLLPYDMQDESSLDSDVRKFGLSDRVLVDALRKIKALKKVLVLDACGAAAATALEILARGPAAERAALEMLARAEGIFIIAASTPQQEAIEIPELGHGVLTYAILSGLGVGSDAVGRDVVTMHQLLAYISLKVPELAARYGRRTRQVPVTFHHGMDFPLIVH